MYLPIGGISYRLLESNHNNTKIPENWDKGISYRLLESNHNDNVETIVYTLVYLIAY